MLSRIGFVLSMNFGMHSSYDLLKTGGLSLQGNAVSG
jgi:hypothetical protein